MRSDFITLRRLENLHVVLLAEHNHTSYGVRLGDHYMPLNRLTIDASYSCHSTPN
jgi:hypothetical protein